MSVADDLRALGVHGILITAAEQGKIDKVACQMPMCLCPEELGGREHFEVAEPPLTLWAPNLDHIELESQGGRRTLDNVRLAHCVCNRVDYNKNHGIPYAKDLASVEKVRVEAIKRRSGGN